MCTLAGDGQSIELVSSYGIPADVPRQCDGL
jgi:hypothetical protein